MVTGHRDSAGWVVDVFREDRRSTSGQRPPSARRAMLMVSPLFTSARVRFVDNRRPALQLRRLRGGASAMRVKIDHPRGGGARRRSEQRRSGARLRRCRGAGRSGSAMRRLRARALTGGRGRWRSGSRLSNWRGQPDSERGSGRVALKKNRRAMSFGRRSSVATRRRRRSLKRGAGRMRLSP